MAGQSVKIEGVILSGNYAIKGMILKGGNAELGALVGKVKGAGVKINPKASSFAFTIDELKRLNFENSQVSFAGGKLTRKAGFKVGNCDLYMMDSSGKPVKVKDKDIRLTKRIIVDNKVAGYCVEFMGKTLKLDINNIVMLSNIFKPVDYTIAVRDGIIRRKDPSTGKVVETTGKKPYLVGINGNRLSELPEEVIANAKPKKESPNSEANKEAKKEKKSKAFIDTTLNIKPYIGKDRLYDFMLKLRMYRCALAYVNEPGKALGDGISDFGGLEVTLPKLICYKSLDIKLTYKRIGIMTAGKSKIAIHKPIDRYIFNKLKIVGGLTIICGESKLSSLGDSIDINSKNELDSRVAKVIANVLGDAFKLESKMYYFNVDLKGMKFGSNTGIGLNKIDDNTLSSMLFNSIKYSYLSENIGVALYSSFVGSGFKDESLRNADESTINKLKELRINTKELRLPYYMLKGDIKFSVKDRTFGIPHTDGSRVSVIQKSREKLSKDLGYGSIKTLMEKLGELALADLTENDSPKSLGKWFNERTGSLICNYELEELVPFFYIDDLFKGTPNEALGARYAYELKNSWEERSNYYNLLVAEVFIRSFVKGGKIDSAGKVSNDDGIYTFNISSDFDMDDVHIDTSVPIV